MNQWLDRETELWNQVMNPPRRAATWHSIPKTATGKRKQVQNQIDKQKVKEFQGQWNALRLLLDH